MYGDQAVSINFGDENDKKKKVRNQLDLSLNSLCIVVIDPL